MKKTIAVFIWK